MPVTIDGTTGVTTPGATVGAITGILKATSGVVSQAVAGTDYLVGGGSAITSTNTAKAWVNFNGTLATPITPRASYNVSSVTKSGTGVYTINFPVGALADANYSICGTVGRGAGFTDPRIIGIGNTNPTSSAAQVSVIDNAGTFEDCEFTMVAIFGN